MASEPPTFDALFLKRASILIRLEQAEFELVSAEHRYHRAQLASRLDGEAESRYKPSDALRAIEKTLEIREGLVVELNECDQELELVLRTHRPDLFEISDSSNRTSAVAASATEHRAKEVVEHGTDQQAQAIQLDQHSTPLAGELMDDDSKSGQRRESPHVEHGGSDPITPDRAANPDEELGTIRRNGALDHGAEQQDKASLESAESRPAALQHQSSRSNSGMVVQSTSQLERFMAIQTQAAAMKIRQAQRQIASQQAASEEAQHSASTDCSTALSSAHEPTQIYSRAIAEADNLTSNTPNPALLPQISVREAVKSIEFDRSAQKRDRAQFARRQQDEDILKEAGHTWAAYMLLPPLPQSIWNETWRALPSVPCLRIHPTEGTFDSSLAVTRRLIDLRLRRRLQELKCSGKSGEVAHHPILEQQGTLSSYVQEANELVKLEEALRTACDGCCDLCAYYTPRDNEPCDNLALPGGASPVPTTCKSFPPHSHSHSVVLEAQQEFDPLLLADAASALLETQAGDLERSMMFGYLFSSIPSQTPTSNTPHSQPLPEDVSLLDAATDAYALDEDHANTLRQNLAHLQPTSSHLVETLAKPFTKGLLEDPAVAPDGLLSDYPAPNSEVLDASDSRAALRARKALALGMSPGWHRKEILSGDSATKSHEDGQRHGGHAMPGPGGNARSALASKVEAVVKSRPTMVVSASESASALPAFVFDLDAADPTTFYVERNRDENLRGAMAVVSPAFHSGLPFAVPESIEAVPQDFTTGKLFDLAPKLRWTFHFLLQELSSRVAAALFGFDPNAFSSFADDASRTSDSIKVSHDSAPLVRERPYSTSAVCWHEVAYLEQQSDPESLHQANFSSAPDISRMAPLHFGALGAYDDSVLSSRLTKFWDDDSAVTTVGQAAQHMTLAATLYDLIRTLPDIFEPLNDTLERKLSGDSRSHHFYHQIQRSLDPQLVQQVRSFRSTLAQWTPACRWLQFMDTFLQTSAIGEELPSHAATTGTSALRLDLLPNSDAAIFVISRDHLFVLASKLLVLGLASNVPSNRLLSLFCPPSMYLPQPNIVEMPPSSDSPQSQSIIDLRSSLAGFSANCLSWAESRGSSQPTHPSQLELIFGRQTPGQAATARDKTDENDKPYESHAATDIIDAFLRDLTLATSRGSSRSAEAFRTSTQSGSSSGAEIHGGIPGMVAVAPLMKLSRVWAYPVDSRQAPTSITCRYHAVFNHEISDGELVKRFTQWTSARMLRTQAALLHCTDVVGKSRRLYVLTAPFSDLAELIRRQCNVLPASRDLPQHIAQLGLKYLFQYHGLRSSFSAARTKVDWELYVTESALAEAALQAIRSQSSRPEPNEWEDISNAVTQVPHVDISESPGASQVQTLPISPDARVGWYSIQAPCTTAHWGELVELLLAEMEHFTRIGQ